MDIDEDKITQVLYNVISNSLKYSPEGGQVTFRVRASDGFIVVSITDQGVGIPKNVIDKIFDRFYRVDKARSRNLGRDRAWFSDRKRNGRGAWRENMGGKCGWKRNYGVLYTSLRTGRRG